MKNYICTGKGFVKSAGFIEDKQEFVIEYTDKLRYAQKFNTKGATKFMENHEILGFVYKPHEEEAIRSLYLVEKNCHHNGRYFQEENPIEEWVVRKAVMANESDVKFLLSGKLVQENLMSFEEAKTKALELNLEAIVKFQEKIKEITESNEENL